MDSSKDVYGSKTRIGLSQRAFIRVRESMKLKNGLSYGYKNDLICLKQ